MSIEPSPPAQGGPRKLGLPAWGILLLAALGAPWVILHDLGIAAEDRWLMAVLALAPPLIWIVAATRARVPSPAATLTVVGACYGVILTVSHNIFWSDVFGTANPGQGGRANLESGLPDWTLELAARIAASLSSLLTGVVVGLLAGLVAQGIRRFRSNSAS